MKASVYITIICFKNKTKEKTKVFVPKKIKENKGLSYNGIRQNGKGFVLSFEEADEIIKQNPKNQECLKILIIGRDLNQKWTWSGSRMIIDFQDWPLEKAMEYKECFEIVKNKVKLQRFNSINKTNDQLRKYWWQFASSGKIIRTQIESFNRIIVTSRVSKHRFFTFIATEHIIPDSATIIIMLNQYSILGILSSKIHIVWAKHQGSTLGDAQRYTNTTVFETFPFPQTHFCDS
ncbi:MAG: hypothetical protein OQJ78_05765 [Ignavibacteriaceae bacterium]|nr:hypothetical protein [Ignavibacteriaceae bacterium]